MPAWFAAKGRNMQIAPNKPKRGVHVLGRNALERRIAADGAMGVERIA